ncbi:SDR family oxidoreductase [Rhodococcus hoagii]|nr:SDR family oxidoreductase [Prescottella equi]
MVTGGSRPSGIGFAVARRLTAEGGRRGGHRQPPQGCCLRRAAESLRTPWQGNLRPGRRHDRGRTAARLVTTAVAEFGAASDGAFNNAGGVNASGPDLDRRHGQLEAELTQNVTSVFHCLKYQIPAVLETGGAIVNNASNMGVVALPEAAPYVAAKHAVVGLTRSVALEVADRGVRVNAITTGGVATPLRGGRGWPPHRRRWPTSSRCTP